MVQVQQTQMSPVAGMKLLTVQQQIGGGRSRVRFSAEVRDVRNALLFVYHQIFDDLQILRRRLRHQVFRGITIGASIVHVHVHVSAHPLGARILRQIQRLQADYQAGILIRRNRHALSLEAIFEPLHDFDVGVPDGQSHFGIARDMKVVRFERPFGADEIVIRVHPGVIGSVCAPVFADYENTRRRRTPGSVQHRDAQFANGLEVMFLFYQDLRLRAARNVLHPQRRIAATIRDKGNTFSIRRPSRRNVVEITIGKRKGVATVGRNHPQLVPLLPQIRRIHDAFAVGRKIRPRFPGGFFIVNLARLQRRAPPSCSRNPRCRKCGRDSKQKEFQFRRVTRRG